MEVEWKVKEFKFFARLIDDPYGLGCFCGFFQFQAKNRHQERPLQPPGPRMEVRMAEQSRFDFVLVITDQ